MCFPFLLIRHWRRQRKNKSMEGGGAGKGLDGQMILTGKETSENGAAKSIPPCCLKARASAPELEAKWHSTVVSGWFSEPWSCSSHHLSFS